MSSSFSRTQISHYLLHICPFKAWDKMSAGPQGMETSHDLAFRNIPLPHTSDEKGFQPWGWKYTPSSRVPLLPLLNATSWNHPRTPAVAHTHTHTPVLMRGWCILVWTSGHTLFALGHGGQPPGKGPALWAALWKLSCTGPLPPPALFVHPQKVLSNTSGRGSNFQVLTTTPPVPPRSSNAGSHWLQV